MCNMLVYMHTLPTHICATSSKICAEKTLSSCKYISFRKKQEKHFALLNIIYSFRFAADCGQLLLFLISQLLILLHKIHFFYLPIRHYSGVIQLLSIKQKSICLLRRWSFLSCLCWSYYSSRLIAQTLQFPHLYPTFLLPILMFKFFFLLLCKRHLYISCPPSFFIDIVCFMIMLFSSSSSLSTFLYCSLLRPKR